MALGKNFRLPLDVTPVRYRALFAPSLAAGTFEGKLELELNLARPRRDLVLHALDLTVESAQARASGKIVRAEKIVPDAESETVTLSFEGELPAGPLVVDLSWHGNFSPGLRGLYRAGPLAVTQFEAADARRVFPCLDEPAFKARWQITLSQVPKGATAIGNGAVETDEELPGGARRVAFHETPPLSSYLIALCVGELVGSAPVVARKVPIRTWSLPAKKHLTAFAQECAQAVLPLLEDYFGQPYAYGKLDQIGVPDFEAGAMENAGAITFREVALLLDAATAPLSLQKRVAEVITHELAHQWFGNLVTMVWWDDLWLNEAFATWMAYKIVDAWRPGWRVWMDFEVGKGAALHLDALRSSHPIRAEIRNAEEAGEAFDAITYEKGGAILRMIEGWLGEDAFRAGIRLYMRKHREKNATADDLWGALAESSSQPILELANGWIRQTGYPLVELSEAGGSVALKQRRFFSDPEAREQGVATRWLVPVVLRFRDDKGVHERRVLLPPGGAGEARVDLEAKGAVRWVLANSGARGFYRASYPAASLRCLIDALPDLDATERMALVSDQWALVRSGNAGAAPFLDLLAGLGGETDHVVLDEVVSRFSWIEHRGVSDADRPRFQAFVAKALAGAAAALGWEPREKETDEVRLQRAAVLRGLTLVARERAAVAEAEARFRTHVGKTGRGVDPNLLDLVVAAAARTADSARFDELARLARAEVDPAAKRRYLHALAMVEADDLVPRAVSLALSDAVQMQDFSSYVGTLLASRAAREQAWRIFEMRWQEVRKKADSPMLLRRLVEALGNLPERSHLAAIEAFLASHPIDGARQAIAQTLERLRMDVALRERLMPEVGAWLRSR
ncbi:MAG TPA: M1 family metallopeptidase [Myxococcales bacterium]|nr:M1 family metallopeptidase [Myxococcales bacterium]